MRGQCEGDAIGVGEHCGVVADDIDDRTGEVGDESGSGAGRDCDEVVSLGRRVDPAEIPGLWLVEPASRFDWRRVRRVGREPLHTARGGVEVLHVAVGGSEQRIVRIEIDPELRERDRRPRSSGDSGCGMDFVELVRGRPVDVPKVLSGLEAQRPERGATWSERAPITRGDFPTQGMGK